jgi:hypothetical protein
MLLQCSSSTGTATRFGRTAAGRGALCVTGLADQIDLIRSVKGDSFISFGVSPTGACDFVTVENASFDEPKVP